MRKRSLSTQTLKINDWMRYRPYERFSPYDGYYLKQANAIFDCLNRPNHGFRQLFEREQLKEVAVLITSHFEDFVNEIGLWQALIRKHTEFYGFALPFYQLDDYDSDYLNPQDFAYLIWHQLSKISHKSINPYSSAILNMAEFCYEFFEERIEEAPTTTFYDNWLRIEPDIAFFDLKLRLKWMAFESYLTGPEFTRLLMASIEEMADTDSQAIWDMDPGKLIYALEDDFLYLKRSSFCAMTTLDWLAEIARCPDELRPDIRRLSQRVYGLFLYEGCDDRYYHFRYFPTKRLFHIQRESIDLDVGAMKPGAELGLFGIVNWRGEWWLSGTFMGWPTIPKAGEELSTGISFCGWSEAEQQQIRESTADLEESFLNFFGDRLALFPNQAELIEAMEAQQYAFNVQLAKKRGKSAPPKPKSTSKSESFPDLDFESGGKGLAVFFIPGEGQFISPLIQEIIRLLRAEKLEPKEADELFNTFFTHCHPALARFLAERYSGKNLRFPFIDDPVFVDDHFEFLLRYLNPGEFREPTPQMSLIRQQE